MMKFILLIFVFSKILQKISFITLMKRVISFVCVPISCFWISIHTPAKGVTISSICTLIKFANFNPHSREGSDDQQEYINSFAEISIHTPAKGVTGTWHGIVGTQMISIHTPTKGVT